MRRLGRPHISPALIAALVVLLVGGGAAVASIPAANGVISGCSRKSSGALRIIDTSKHGFAGKCRKNERYLGWSQLGPRGLQGAKGVKGAQGIKGAQGVQGAQGTQGIPGPLTTMAPPGITQHGLFNVLGYQTAGGLIGGSISFPLELAAAPIGAVEVPYLGTNPDPAHCSGTPDAPTAAAGYLCLYDRFASNAGSGANLQLVNVDDHAGASPFGVGLIAQATATGEVQVEGSWAVTAP